MKKQTKGVVNSLSKILLRVILIKAHTSNTVCCFLTEGMSCHSERGHKAFWRPQSRAVGPRRGFRSLVLSSPSAPYRLAVDLRHHATKSTSHLTCEVPQSSRPRAGTEEIIGSSVPQHLRLIVVLRLCQPGSCPLHSWPPRFVWYTGGYRMKPHPRANLANLARRTPGDGGGFGKKDGHGSKGSGGKGTPSGPSAGPGHD